MNGAGVRPQNLEPEMLLCFGTVRIQKLNSVSIPKKLKRNGVTTAYLCYKVFSDGNNRVYIAT